MDASEVDTALGGLGAFGKSGALAADTALDLLEGEPLERWLYEQFFIAYQKARKGKLGTQDEHQFDVNALENLQLLVQDVLQRTYKPSRGIAFVTYRPVIREIFAAPFRDRVIHHFLYNMVADWWDRRMIYDSYSCRVGKGTHFGVQRLAKQMRDVTHNYTHSAYVIKLDVQGYFMSLPRAGLYERICWGLERQFPDGGPVYRILRYLWREVIFDDPTVDVIRRGTYRDWQRLPRSKSLFCQPYGRGIVIGNLSSQLLSNIYLDLLDRFVKLQLGYKYYGRYVDDFFLLVPPEQLPQAKRDVAVIADFLAEIGLKLHPHKRYIQPVERGVPFLGARVYPGRVVVDKRILQNFRRAAYQFGTNGIDEATINSYLGHMKHLDAHRTCQRIFDSVGWEYRY